MEKVDSTSRENILV